MSRKKIVALTGAGISAESGLQTFRDSNGLWEGYNVEEVATPEGWQANPGLVLEFYNLRRKAALEAEPNAGHIALAGLQDKFDVTIITQNIDNLHEKAGSENVCHLHGEIFKMRSEQDKHLIYPIEGDINLGDFAEDGCQLRPHIVWFGEDVPMMGQVIEITETADIFVVIGTSLVVYPAAGLINYVNDKVPIFVIDKSIPKLPTGARVTAIEMPATKGVAAFAEILSKDYA